MSDLETYRDALEVLVPGPHPIDDLLETKTAAIERALARHSREFPRVVVEDVAGDGSGIYALASVLTDWDGDFSHVRQVEYPADESPPVYLEPDTWMVYRHPLGYRLRFSDASPAVGETIRITYTAGHTITETESTIPATADEGVQALAAACYADILAVKYAQSQDSTIGADSVEQSSKRRDFAAVAKMHLEFYKGYFGIQKGPGPSSANQDWDWNNAPGTDRLTHPKRLR